MGLKCSLLGHSFDETDVEREREERGSEVVTIVKEVERCSRCSEVRILSENKEVTSIVDPDEVDLDDEASESGSSTALGSMASEASGSGFESGSDLDEFESPGNPDEEDAEILEDNRPSDRRPGQWPDDEDDWDPDRLTRPDGPDETAGDTETSESAADRPAATEADGPESVPESSGGGEFIDAEADPANADADAETDTSESTAGSHSVPDGAFACPECGFTTSAANTPLRAGDACPECQRGYLEAGE